MKIVICGSVNFPEKMKEAEKHLVEKGHEVVMPYGIKEYNINTYEDAQRLKERSDYIEMVKEELTARHFDEIKSADAILVINMDKRGIPNYIGGATFAEMMFAFYHKKKIFLLNPIPTHEKMSIFHDEVKAIQPVVINSNLDMIK